MLAWTGYVRDAETKAPLFGLGTICTIPGIEDHLEHVAGYGYPSRYSGTAGELVWEGNDVRGSVNLGDER